MSLRRALACWAAAALLLAGCGGSDEPRKAPAPQTLTVATGGQGGIYAVWGAAYARAISKSLEATAASPPPRRARSRTSSACATAGRRSRSRSATPRSTPSRAARRSTAPWRCKALAQIYPSYVQVVTRADSDIGTLEDLEGKRVSVGSPDSGTQVVADRVLDVAKVGGFKRRQLGVEESARALERGQIDAFFWSGGVPTAAVADLSKRTPVGARRPAPLRARDAPALGRRLRRRDASRPAPTGSTRR